MEAGAKQRTYKIGQAAKLLDVKPFVLRFWESEFKDALVPVRTPSGQRAYTEANVATVREIKRLLYDEGLTIEGAKKRLGQKSACPAGVAAPPAPPSLPLLEAAAAAPRQAAGAPAPGPQTSGPQLSDQADASAQDAARAEKRADALAATLEDVARELSAIRDLLT